MSAATPAERGRERLAAHRRRAVRIRRGVGAATICAFALAWGVIAHAGSTGTATAQTAQSATTTDQGSSSTAPSDTPLTTTQS